MNGSGGRAGWNVRTLRVDLFDRAEDLSRLRLMGKMSGEGRAVGVCFAVVFAASTRARGNAIVPGSRTPRLSRGREAT